MDTIDFLRKTDLFKNLKEEELIKISASVSKISAPKNTLILSNGDTSNSMYLIKSGKVNVTFIDKNGNEMILTTLQQGDYFGELSIIDNLPRSANIFTIEKCEFIVLHRHDFLNLLEYNSSIAIGMLKYLCERIRFTTNITQGFALLNVYGRIRSLLYSLAESFEGEVSQIGLPLTHQDIASRVGSSRVMITRIINELEKGGYISIKNKIITIHRKLPYEW